MMLCVLPGDYDNMPVILVWLVTVTDIGLLVF